MKFGAVHALLALLFVQSLVSQAFEEKSFVVVIPTYNNEREVVEKNLTSVLEQKYENYRVIIIDDCSPNETFLWCKELIACFGQENRVIIVRNEERCGALANTYAAIHSCSDNEIWIVLDGDDWFPHADTLATFNKYYHERNALASFGQYVAWPTGEVGHAEAFPEDVIRKNTLRSYRLPSKRAFLPITAPRTGYAWIFKLIKLQDLLADDGYFYLAAGDYAYMIPVLEMSGMRGIFIPDILYIYNIKNPIADARVNAKLQASVARHILSSKPYCPVSEPATFEILGADDVASLIIFSSHDADSLARTLREVVRLVKPVSRIIVLYQSDQEHQHCYSDLISSFPNIVWIKYIPEQLKDCIQQQLWSCTTKYVLLASDAITIDQKIDLRDAIAAMKKTHVQLFFNGIGRDEKEFFLQSRLPAVDLAHTRYAWFCSNLKTNIVLPILSLAVISRDQLSALVDSMPLIDSSEQFEIALSDACKQSNMLSLIGKTAIVHTKDSLCRKQ